MCVDNRRHIDGTISLRANTAAGTGGAFSLRAHTTNAPLTLALASSPSLARTDLNAGTVGAAARVSLPRPFEGTFALASSASFAPTVEWDADRNADGGRARAVRVEKLDKGAVGGAVAWEEGGEARGRVDVRTTGAPLRLVLE